MFDKKIKSFRAERGYTLEELGVLVGVAKTTVANWEAGINHPNSETLIKLARLFGTTTDYLLGMDDDINRMAEGMAETLKDRQSEKAKELYQRMLDSGMDEGSIENYIEILLAVTNKKPPK